MTITALRLQLSMDLQTFLFVPIPDAVISFILESSAFLNDINFASFLLRMFKSGRLRSSRKCLSNPHAILYREYIGWVIGWVTTKPGLKVFVMGKFNK